MKDASLSESPEPSKSQRKREAEQLQQLGAALAALKPVQLDAMDLPEKLRAALADYQRFPSHGAKRRQLQFIGKLMRDVDAASLKVQLDGLLGESAAQRDVLHHLERWRTRLLTEDDALTDYLDEHPTTDRQRLRQLVAKTRRSTANGSDIETPQAKADYRALFRFLRDET